MRRPKLGKSGGVELTDALVERLADAAERGYDVKRPLRPMPVCICPNPQESVTCPGIPVCWCPLHFATWREYVETDRARYVPHPD